MPRTSSPLEQEPNSAILGLTTAGAVILASAAAALALSILAASLDRVPLLAAPGAFFFEAYGYLAFLVPAYLLIAALILADRAYRPDRIFALSCTVVPFLTLAAGVALLRDPAHTFDRYPLLESMGLRGIASIIAAATALECLGIVSLTAALFPARRPAPKADAGRARAQGDRSTGDRSGQDRSENDRSERGAFAPLVRFLPPPKETGGGIAEGRDAESPAVAGLPLGGAGAPTLSLDLPELKPLSSLAAERELSGQVPDADELEAEGVFMTPLGPLHAAARGGHDAGLPEEGEAPAVVDLSSLLSRGSDGRAAEEIIDPTTFFDDAQEPAGSFAGSGRATFAAAESPEEAERAADAESAADGNPDGEPAADEVLADEELPDEAPAPKHPVDDLSRALSEAEADAEAKSRAAEEAAAAKAAEAEHRARELRKRRNEPYGVPVDGILTAYPDGQYWVIDQATRDAAVILKETLEEFNIAAEVTGIRKGPVITMFEILPAPGVKLSKIVNLQDNIALRLAASSVRIVAPIPGKHAVGIEVPNRKRNIVSFREMIEGELGKEAKETKKAEIPVILGKDITGEAQTLDLVQTPHLLIAGATGSGKSVCVNSMILSILYTRSPAEVRLILIDPKIVELKLYNDIPHLLTPVITEPKRAFQALQYCIYEMERRYALLDSMGVRDVRSYNKRIRERNIATERLPYIVVVIDEFADLMATTGKELESTVARLAAMSRAVGIHLVLATQRPSIDVITGLIKANIPSRIAFMVAGKMDSRIIIDMVGAEKLLGKGDMLVASAWDPFPIRMQGAFVSEEEVERVVEYVKTLGEPDYLDEEIFYDEDEEDAEPSLFGEDEDPLFEKALEIVHQQGKASASYIQRRLKIGYNRAARLVELMEDRGIVGPAQGSKPRDLLRGS